MNPLDLVKLTALMELTSGRPEIVIGLMEGPVAANHPDLAGENIRALPGSLSGTCIQVDSAACMHGTFVAGILCAKRNSPAPAICPNCTLLVRPIFAEMAPGNKQTLSATPEELAFAIIESIEAGANVLNLSVALDQPSTTGHRKLEEALDYAARRGVITVAAAGNQGTLGSSAITRHPWVIPVVAYDLRGRPIGMSNLGGSIGRYGLGAPGDGIRGLGVDGKSVTLAGTSVAAPFVTGTIALLWSEFPTVGAAAVKFAVTHAYAPKRTTVVPPLLDAWAAYQFMTKAHLRR
jgi:subtilisin family serine protease